MDYFKKLKQKQKEKKEKVEKIKSRASYSFAICIILFSFIYIFALSKYNQMQNQEPTEPVKLEYSDELVINTPEVESIDGAIFDDQSEIIAEAIVEEKEAKKVEVGEVAVQKTEPLKEWKPFLEHTKKNPFSGAVFANGNHLQIAQANINRYKGFDGCHPYLLASLHYSETGLQMNNGWNGQGAYQHYSSQVRYTPNSTITPAEFRQQTQKTCEFIRNKVGGADLSSLENVNLIGKALALYNGCYSPGIGNYARADFGAWNGWDKCPYVANKLQNNKAMLQCAVDGCSRWNYRSTYGTLTFIAYLLNN